MSEFPVRLHGATVDVLRAFIQEPTRELYGLELCQMTGRPNGSLYPILARLEDAGILSARLENPIPAGEQRRARRYYSLTDSGRAKVPTALAAADARARSRAGFLPRPVAGAG